MKKFFGFTIFFLLLSSCTSKDSEPKIRIVDLEGKSHSVVTRFPEMNVQALAAQGISQERPNFVQPKNNQPVVQNQNSVSSEQDFGAVSSREIQNTLQSSQAENENKSADNSLLAAGSADEASDVVEYDLSQDDKKADDKKAGDKKVTEKKSTKKSSKKSVAEKSSHSSSSHSSGRKYYAQVGSFSNQGNADNALDKMKKFHSGRIETVEGEKTVYRVLLGPFSNKSQAKALVSKIKKSGNEAILVRSK